MKRWELYNETTNTTYFCFNRADVERKLKFALTAGEWLALKEGEPLRSPRGVWWLTRED